MKMPWHVSATPFLFARPINLPSFSWHLEKDGKLIGRANKKGVALTCQGIFMGPRFEAEAAVELPESPLACAGVSLASRNPADYRGVWIERGDGVVSVFDDFNQSDEQDVPLSKINVIKLTRWDESVFVALNGRKLFETEPTDCEIDPNRQYLGVGGRDSPEGTEIRLTNIRVRKLSMPPGGN